MRSRFGVGITPPNVLETPKPVSSVMISRTFGAPLGGTTRAGQYGVDCAALRSILPRNCGGGGGSCCPGTVVVAASANSAQLVNSRRETACAICLGNLIMLISTKYAITDVCQEPSCARGRAATPTRSVMIAPI